MKTCVDFIDYCFDWYQSPKRPYWNKFDYHMWLLSINMLYGIEDYYLESWSSDVGTGKGVNYDRSNTYMR